MEEDELEDEAVSNEIILYDIKDTWDDLWELYSRLFECPFDISVTPLINLGIKFELEKPGTAAYGTVHALKEDGIPFKISFNKIIYGFKQKYYYSVIIHEMCHLATLLSDYDNKTYNPKEYEDNNGHTEGWHRRANRFNKLTNKNGEPLFEVIPYLDREKSLEDMLE